MQKIILNITNVIFIVIKPLFFKDFIVTKLVKDIHEIYASYKVNQPKYIEITEQEMYMKVQERWLTLYLNQYSISASLSRFVSSDFV